MLIALAARADAAPAVDPIALAVRYADILTGVDPDEEVARLAPDDPDDQRAGTSSDDEDDDRPGRLDDRGDLDGDHGGDDGGGGDGDDRDDAEARADRLLPDEPAGAVAITSDETGFAAPAAGAAERYEAGLRRRRSWILGRLDVGLAWRHRRSEPMHAMANVSNEVWLLATWRR